MNQPGIQWKVRDPVFFFVARLGDAKMLHLRLVVGFVARQTGTTRKLWSMLGHRPTGYGHKVGVIFHPELQHWNLLVAFLLLSKILENGIEFTIYCFRYMTVSSYLHYLHQHSPSVPMLVWKNGFDRHFLVFLLGDLFLGRRGSTSIAAGTITLW